MFTYNNATMQRKIYKYRMRSNYVNYKRLFFLSTFMVVLRSTWKRVMDERTFVLRVWRKLSLVATHWKSKTETFYLAYILSIL